MTGLVITGVGCLSPAAAAQLAPLDTTPDLGRDVTACYPDPLPTPRAHAIADFDPRQLGLKGAAFRSRATNLALAACGRALADSGLLVGDDNRGRVGVVIGCAEGSLKAACDYTTVTITDPSPRHGSAALFPGTVINHTAGQCAIHYGLKGVNTTIASGRLAFLRVLAYTATMLRRGRADTILAGVVEEFTPQSAWLSRLAEPAGIQGMPAGEGAAAFVVESADHARGRHVDAAVLAVATGFDPTGGRGTRQLTDCVLRVLGQAGLGPHELSRVITDDQRTAAVLRALHAPAELPYVGLRHAVGECRAAGDGLLMAGLLALHRDSTRHDGQCSLLVGTDRDGGVGAAVIQAWGRPPGAGHREGH